MVDVWPGNGDDIWNTGLAVRRAHGPLTPTPLSRDAIAVTSYAPFAFAQPYAGRAATHAMESTTG